MNNYEEKITNIKETEKYILELARNAITTQNKILNLNIQDLICNLNYDETSVKKYEATLKAQMLIEKFTNDILEAKDIDEIKSIRNRLNYYINKVKTEIKERNVSEEDYNKYYDNASILRKNIATYIRYIKREDNIKEIERLNSNIDNLNEEELNNLKRLIKLETNYGKTHKEVKIEKKNNNTVKINKAVNKENRKDPFDISKLFKEFKEKELPKEENKNSIILNFSGQELPKEEKKNSIVIDFTAKPTQPVQSCNRYETLESYLSFKLNTFQGRYNLQRLNKYDGGLVHNMSEFIKNVPKFRSNKKKINRMEEASVYYDRTPEFVGYIEYNRRENSIFKNIKDVFKNSALRNKEKVYLEEHKKCIEWIKRFCTVNHMHIDYKKRVY